MRATLLPWATGKVAPRTEVPTTAQATEDPHTLEREALPLTGPVSVLDSYWYARERRVTVLPPPHSVVVRLLRLTFAASGEESWLGECARNHDFESVNVSGAADGRPAGTA